MNRHTEGPGVPEWMERSRRAQQLVAQVNLKRIVEHDASEFEKLTKVNKAMDLLCKEGASTSTGLDVIEEAPTLDEHQVKRSELMNVLDAAGYGDRLGRIFMSNFDERRTVRFYPSTTLLAMSLTIR